MNITSTPLAAMNISMIDLAVIVVYLVGIMMIGILSVRKMKLTGDVYFLAGRALGWPIVGAALFASNISTIHLVGLAEDGYGKGLVVGNFEWMATFTLFLLALVFAPFYFRSKIATLPEFLEKRYSSLARSIMAFMAILAALLIHIGLSLYAGSVVFETFFGIPIWLSIIIISVVTAIYTVVGGLRAVVVTETIQTVILLGGAILITYLAISKLPDHDVHNWADFNMKIDVQHSAETMDQAANALAGSDWLMKKSPELVAAHATLKKLGELEAKAAGDNASKDQLVADTKAFAESLKRKKQLDLLTFVIDNKELSGVLTFDPKRVEADAVEMAEKLGNTLTDEQIQERIAESYDNKFDEALNKETFSTSAKALGEDLEKPEEASVDIMWRVAQGIKDGEKLNFVVSELDKANFSDLGAIFADQAQWDNFATQSAQFAAAAEACKSASKKITETGDMTQYTGDDKPTRTPRLSMLRSEGPFNWLAILLGYPILGVWYWCSDQTIVQRVLGARNQNHAQNGALFAGLLKITPAFLMVLPGTIAFVIFREQIGGDAASTLPVMITKLMPVGLMGLMAAGLMAALMSTIAAALNSVGTLVAKDIVGHFRPQTSDAAQVRIGRIAAVVLMLVAMAWSTQGGQFGSIFVVINKIPALFLAPPITTVFVWGVFWKRGTKQAAIATLICGLSIGFVLFLADTGAFGGKEWISSQRYGLGIPFMIQAFMMFCVWSVFYVVVSLMTPKPAPEQVENTTWPNPLAVIFHGKLKGWYDPRLITITLFVVMVILYYVFR